MRKFSFLIHRTFFCSEGRYGSISLSLSRKPHTQRNTITTKPKKQKQKPPTKQKRPCISLQTNIIAATLGSEPLSRNRWKGLGGAFRRALGLCCPSKGRGEEQGGPEVGSPLRRGLCAPNTRHSWPSGSRGGNSSRATLPSEEPPKNASPGRPLWAFLCPPRCGAGWHLWLCAYSSTARHTAKPPCLWALLPKKLIHFQK